MYPDREKVLSDLDMEHIHARRALRVASWWSVFFLVRSLCPLAVLAAEMFL